MISTVTKDQTLCVSLQTEAKVSSAAGKMGGWELYVADVSGCYDRGIFLHAHERKGQQPWTYFRNLQVWSASDAREICLVSEHIHNSHLPKGVCYFIAPRNRKFGEVEPHCPVR